MFCALRPLTCLILLATLPGLAAAGDRGRGPAPVQQAPMPQDQISRDVRQAPTALPDSVRRVERTTGGEVLRAEPMQRDGREVYRMKVLTADGRIRVVQEDPNPVAPAPRREAHKGKDKDKDASSADSQDADSPPPQE